MFITNAEKPSILLTNIFKFLMLTDYVKAFAFVQIFVALLLVFCQSLYFIENFEKILLLKYAPLYFACIYLLFTNIIYLVFFKQLKNQLTSNQMLFCPIITKISKQTRTTISREIRKMNKHFIFQFFIGFSGIILTLISWNTSNDNLLYQIFEKLLKKAPAAFVVLQFTIYILFILLIIPTVAIPTYFKYVVFHIKIHTIILIDAVYQFRENLTYYDHHKNENWELNEYVYMNLKKIAKKHIEIIRYGRVLQKNQLLYVVYIFDGLMVGFISTFGLFSPLFKWYQAMPTALGFTFFAYSLCNYSQDLENLGNEFSNALFNLNWYKWNLRCQKVYLVLFAYSTKGIPVLIFSWFAVNRILFKNVLRIVYTVASCLRSLKN